MFFRSFREFSLVFLLFISQGLYAANTDVQFSGFASLVYARSVHADTEGLLNNMSDAGEYRDYNIIGLRMNADLYDKVSFTAQMVSYGSENYDPEFDWIFASFELTDELRLDIGKTRIPMYYYSDFIDVGYAYQWIKPPSTVYVAGRSFFQSVEGLKLSYITTMDEWESELLGFGGKTEQHFSSIDGKDQIDLYIHNLMGAAWTVEHDWLMLRAVYVQGDITLGGYSSFDALLSAIQGLGAAINTIQPYVDQNITPINIGPFEDMVALKNDTLTFSGIGTSVDFDHVFAIVEISQSLFDDNIAANNSVGGYMTVGVRLPHRITLSTTYGQRHQNANQHILRAYQSLVYNYLPLIPLTSSSSDASIQAAVAAVNEYLDGDHVYDMGDIIRNAINVAQDKTIREYSVQFRWDFHPSAAFKFEYLFQNNDQYSPVNYLPEKVKPQAYRFGVDVVF